MGTERDVMHPELRRLLDLEAGRADPSDALRIEVRRSLAKRLAKPRPSWRPMPRRWTAGITLATSVALGAGVAWKLGREGPAPVVPTVAPPFEPQAAVPPPAPVEPPSVPVEPAAVAKPSPSAAREATKPRPPLDPESSLTRERELIASARRALRGGTPDAALSLLGRHGQEFPRGVLLEERLGLQVEALAASGRIGEARTRGREFLRRFPQSPLRGAVDAALNEGSTPRGAVPGTP